MRQKRETPEPWKTAMADANIRSLNYLAEKAGLRTWTVSRLVHGDNPTGPSGETVQAVAKVLKVDPETVAEWAAAGWRSQPQMPDNAYQLTSKQWHAIERLIDAIVSPDEASSSTGERPKDATVAELPHAAQSRATRDEKGTGAPNPRKRPGPKSRQEDDDSEDESGN